MTESMILKNSVQHLFVRQAKHASCEHPIRGAKFISLIIKLLVVTIINCYVFFK